MYCLYPHLGICLENYVSKETELYKTRFLQWNNWTLLLSIFSAWVAASRTTETSNRLMAFLQLSCINAEPKLYSLYCRQAFNLSAAKSANSYNCRSVVTSGWFRCILPFNCRYFRLLQGFIRDRVGGAAPVPNANPVNLPIKWRYFANCRMWLLIGDRTDIVRKVPVLIPPPTPQTGLPNYLRLPLLTH